MGCSFCNSNKGIEIERINDYNDKLYISVDTLEFDCGDGYYSFSIDIKFCPMCGRKL